MLLKVRYGVDVTEESAIADAAEQWRAKCVERGRATTDTGPHVDVERDTDGLTVVMNDGTADIQ